MAPCPYRCERWSVASCRSIANRPAPQGRSRMGLSANLKNHRSGGKGVVAAFAAGFHAWERPFPEFLSTLFQLRFEHAGVPGAVRARALQNEQRSQLLIGDVDAVQCRIGGDGVEMDRSRN